VLINMSIDLACRQLASTAHCDCTFVKQHGHHKVEGGMDHSTDPSQGPGRCVATALYGLAALLAPARARTTDAYTQCKDNVPRVQSVALPFPFSHKSPAGLGYGGGGGQVTHPVPNSPVSQAFTGTRVTAASC
jgi:hypothetical protein